MTAQRDAARLRARGFLSPDPAADARLARTTEPVVAYRAEPRPPSERALVRSFRLALKQFGL